MKLMRPDITVSISRRVQQDIDVEVSVSFGGASNTPSPMSPGISREGEQGLIEEKRPRDAPLQQRDVALMLRTTPARPLHVLRHFCRLDRSPSRRRGRSVREGQLYPYLVTSRLKSQYDRMTSLRANRRRRVTDLGGMPVARQRLVRQPPALRWEGGWRWPSGRWPPSPLLLARPAQCLPGGHCGAR